MSKYDKKTTEDYYCDKCGILLEFDEIGFCVPCENRVDTNIE